MKIIYERHGCTRLRILFPALVQIPLFLLVSLALRSMSGWVGWVDVGLTVPIEPLLQVEGFGAIKNLTQPDGTYILPVMIGLLNVTNLEVRLIVVQLTHRFQITAARRSIALPEGGIASRLRKITRFSFLTLSVLMIPIAMQAPAVSPILHEIIDGIGYIPLLGNIGRLLSCTKHSDAEIPAHRSPLSSPS